MWRFLASMLPLVLVAPVAAVQRAQPALVVRLDLAGTRYKISHRYTGEGARRFVVGATDKNCDEPVDVLLVDGKLTPLFSALPCGGFSYRAARTMKTGEQWMMEGRIDLGEASHSVVARYCPTPELLNAVDPKVQSQSGPPWWFGCVDSPPVNTSIKR